MFFCFYDINRLLSLLLGTDVQIRTVLQNESPRLADEQSLLVMDIVVQLGDGSIANVEVQKVGYAFPDTYLHWFEQRSDTGLKQELLFRPGRSTRC